MNWRYIQPRNSSNNPIAIARIKRGLTQEQLASMVGVNRRQISEWECEKRIMPLQALQRIAAVLDLDWISLASAQMLKNIEQSPIERIRKQKGVSQIELAKAIGVSQSLISNCENGVIKPKPELLEKIAIALDVSPESLYAK